MPANVENGRNLSGVVTELKEEFKEFIGTRMAMFRSEMNGKVTRYKSVAPMIVVGTLLLATAWLLLTGAIVAAVYVAFAGNPWAAALALIIVCVAYAIFGGVSVWFAIRELRETGMVPTRTLRVLKDDQVWISNEARVQL